jgi:hypothetical protein
MIQADNEATHDARLSVPGVSDAHYDAVDLVKIEALRQRHAWLVEPLYRATDATLQLPFFQWLRDLRSAKDFAPAAVNLYYHSATFPKVMGLMLGLTSMKENWMMPFYAKHAFGEADHHQLLMRWMLEQGILSAADEIENIIPTTETSACVNLAYQLATEQDRDKWLVTINSAIERSSNEFFKVVAPVMRGLGAGDNYFDVHVEADEHHSIMGLEYLTPLDPSSARGKQLVAKGLEGISLWTAMLHSWIGVSLHPRFDLEGRIIGSTH